MQLYYSHLAAVKEVVVSQQLVIHFEQSPGFLHNLLRIG